MTYLITVKVADNGSVEKTYQMLDGKDSETVETMEFFNNETQLLTFRSMSMGAMGAAQHVASVMPKVGKVFENGKLEEGKFTFQLMDEGKKNVLQEATNAADGEVKFDRITYTAPGTYKYVIVEKEGTNKTVIYDDTEIAYTVSVTEDADGELLVSEQYSVDEKVTEDPTFTNKARTIIIRARKKSREAPYDPLNGSTYGIWMANPDGNDVYMGNDISHIDPAIEGDTGGWLDYNVPTTPGVAYYLLEEAAPHGHLVDPYPTDYFTIASNEDGYYLVYQSDPKFFELVPDLKGKI